MNILVKPPGVEVEQACTNGARVSIQLAFVFTVSYVHKQTVNYVDWQTAPYVFAFEEDGNTLNMCCPLGEVQHRVCALYYLSNTTSVDNNAICITEQKTYEN